MNKLTIPTALLALAAFPLDRATGQTQFAFTLDLATSNFTWTGSTNQGLLTGASQAFDVHGALGLDIAADAGGIHSGQFTGGDIPIQPGIFGEFGGSTQNPFEITGARLSLVSNNFAVGAGGNFVATLTPSFLAGNLMMTPPLEQASTTPLGGLGLNPVVISGTLVQVGSTLQLVVPVVLTFDFSIGTVVGTLEMTGTLSAGLDCPPTLSYCTTSPNSVGPGAVIAASGTPSVSTNQFVLEASGVPPSQSGVFFYGEGAAQVPFGNGVLCVASPHHRLPIVTSTVAGDISHLLDVGSPSSPSGQIGAGSAWRFQLWYRDPAAGGAFFNQSDGLRVLFCP